MGRYETLNDDSKDVVNCLIPGIVANFGIEDISEVIPQGKPSPHSDAHLGAKSHWCTNLDQNPKKDTESL